MRFANLIAAFAADLAAAILVAGNAALFVAILIFIRLAFA